ncbi:hypothetical protein V8G54_022759 [Vigna mungo]|uniref:Uncharacterized protein n=1 Tax=Vigna mungo TaxID=3915 RepID=A0AAQ3RQX8_VIGMU
MEISAMASSAAPRPSLPTPSPYPVVTTFTKPRPRLNHIALGLSFWGTSLETKEPNNRKKKRVKPIWKKKMRIWEKSKGLATWVDGLNMMGERLSAARAEISGWEGEEVGSSVLDTTYRVAKVIGNALKPGIETASPIVLKIASPAISEASKKVQSFSYWKTSLEDDVLKEREDGCMGGEGVDLDFAEVSSGEGCTSVKFENQRFSISNVA